MKDCSVFSGVNVHANFYFASRHFNGEEDFMSMPTAVVAGAPSDTASEAGSVGSASAKL